MEVECKGPGWYPNEEYYLCRFNILREPLGFSRGAEILEDDSEAIHSWFEIKGRPVVVGRAHLIPDGSDGSQADHAGPGAAHCPAFTPLQEEGFRPAIQIRQMGTLPKYRRKGLAGLVLLQLERASKKEFSAKYGFLQAREGAIPFYQSHGWEIIDEPYSIERIGPHRSMMKKL